MVADGPRRFGRYEITAELGLGGFATVYRAHDPLLRRDVALKVLHGHLAREPETRERFVREGRALAQVHHRHIVTIYDAGEAEGTAYLAMEIVDGPSLAEILRDDGPLSLHDVLRIVEEIAGALAAVHALGLVHCDVKPANILVDAESGRAVLLDLGVARRVDETASMTGGWLVGTPAFMAPEQVEPGRRLSGQTDVYQLAATTFALLSGEQPFSGEAAQVLYAVVNRPPAWLGNLCPELPAGVPAVLAGALAKDPAERPPGPEAFAIDLRGAALGRLGRHAQAMLQTRGVAPEARTEVLEAGWRPAHGHKTMRTARPPRVRARFGPASGSLLLGGVIMLLVAAGLVALTAWRSGGSTGATGDLRAAATSAPQQSSPMAAAPAVAKATPPPPTPASSPRPASSAAPTAAPPRATEAPVVAATPWAQVLAASASGPVASVMGARGFTPSGPIVPVPAGESTLLVQRGTCGDGCDMLFIFLDGRFLGTDWPQPSARILDVQGAGAGRFVATYADANGAGVPVTFTWDGKRLRPNTIAPGQCQGGC